MPSGSRAVLTATVVFLVGLALAITGVVVLTKHHKGLGFALLFGGFVVVVASSLVARPRRLDEGGDRPRDA